MSMSNNQLNNYYKILCDKKAFSNTFIDVKQCEKNKNNLKIIANNLLKYNHGSLTSKLFNINKQDDVKISNFNLRKEMFWANKKVTNTTKINLDKINDFDLQLFEKINDEIKSSCNKLNFLIEEVKTNKEVIEEQTKEMFFEIRQNDDGEDLFFIDNKLVDENYFVKKLQEQNR